MLVGRISENKGFTLFELLVVLVIISVMFALVGPKFAGSMSNMRLRTTSKKISAALRYARSQATSERISYFALFDFDKDRLSIISSREASDETGEKDSGDDKERPVGSKVYDLPDGIKLDRAASSEGEVDFGIFQIVFFPSGGNSGGEVILANDRGKRYKISVDFITGAVQLGEIGAEA